jgi:hypothetical protein
VTKHAAESLSALNPPGVAAVCNRLGKEKHVSFPLMIALGVEMRNVPVQSATKRWFAEQDQS